MVRRPSKKADIDLLSIELENERGKVLRLENEMERLRTVIESMHETTLGLMNRLRIDDLLEAILKRATNLAGTPDGYMYLLDRNRNTMEMKIGVGMYEKSRIYNMEAGKGFGGEIWKTGKPLTLDNYSTWKGRLEDRRWDNLKAVIGVPLKSDNEVVGIIVLSTTDATRRFSRNDLSMLGRFAEIASVALENARLYFALENELKERIRAENELHSSTERLHAIFNNARDYIYIKNERLEYIDINQAMSNMLGISRGLLLCKSDSDLFDSRTSKILSETDHMVLTGETIEEELEMHVSGKTLYLHNIKIPLRKKDGHITGIFGIARDVTDRKRAEQEIHSAKEAVARIERLASLGAMAAGISHEISQPLNSIKVTATGITYLRDRGIHQDIDDIMRDVRQISSQADLISDIIKHVRAIIHAKNESDIIEQESCTLEEALTMAFQLVGNQLVSHGIEVNIYLASNVPAVYANKTGLVEVIINLLINALEALDMPEKKEKVIEVKLSARNERVYLQIADNGPGIPKNIQSKIFEPFFTTKSRGKSMGLGLSIMQSIVESYGGSLMTSENVPSGAVFEISLPAAKN